MTINIPDKIMQYLDSGDLEMVQLGATLLANRVPKRHLARIMNMFCYDPLSAQDIWMWGTKKWNWKLDSENNLLISPANDNYGRSTTSTRYWNGSTITTSGTAYTANVNIQGSGTGTTCVRLDSSGLLVAQSPVTTIPANSGIVVSNNGGPPSP